jgi:hypothetical protein
MADQPGGFQGGEYSPESRLSPAERFSHIKQKLYTDNMSTRSHDIMEYYRALASIDKPQYSEKARESESLYAAILAIKNRTENITAEEIVQLEEEFSAAQTMLQEAETERAREEGSLPPTERLNELKEKALSENLYSRIISLEEHFTLLAQNEQIDRDDAEKQLEKLKNLYKIEFQIRNAEAHTSVEEIKQLEIKFRAALEAIRRLEALVEEITAEQNNDPAEPESIGEAEKNLPLPYANPTIAVLEGVSEIVINYLKKIDPKKLTENYFPQETRSNLEYIRELIEHNENLDELFRAAVVQQKANELIQDISYKIASLEHDPVYKEVAKRQASVQLQRNVRNAIVGTLAGNTASVTLEMLARTTLGLEPNPQQRAIAYGAVTGGAIGYIERITRRTNDELLEARDDYARVEADTRNNLIKKLNEIKSKEVIYDIDEARGRCERLRARLSSLIEANSLIGKEDEALKLTTRIAELQSHIEWETAKHEVRRAEGEDVLTFAARAYCHFNEIRNRESSEEKVTLALAILNKLSNTVYLPALRQALLWSTVGATIGNYFPNWPHVPFLSIATTVPETQYVLKETGDKVSNGLRAFGEQIVSKSKPYGNKLRTLVRNPFRRFSIRNIFRRARRAIGSGSVFEHAASKTEKIKKNEFKPDILYEFEDKALIFLAGQSEFGAPSNRTNMIKAAKEMLTPEEAEGLANEQRALNDDLCRYHGYFFFSPYNVDGVKDGKAHAYRLWKKHLHVKVNQYSRPDQQNRPDLYKDRGTDINPAAVVEGKFHVKEYRLLSLAVPLPEDKKTQEEFKTTWNDPSDTWQQIMHQEDGKKGFGDYVEVDYRIVFPYDGPDEEVLFTDTEEGTQSEELEANKLTMTEWLANTKLKQTFINPERITTIVNKVLEDEDIDPSSIAEDLRAIASAEDHAPGI